MAYFQGRTVSFRECIHAEQLGHGGAMCSLYLALGFKARVKWLREAAGWFVMKLGTKPGLHKLPCITRWWDSQDSENFQSDNWCCSFEISYQTVMHCGHDNYIPISHIYIYMYIVCVHMCSFFMFFLASRQKSKTWQFYTLQGGCNETEVFDPLETFDDVEYHWISEVLMMGGFLQCLEPQKGETGRRTKITEVLQLHCSESRWLATPKRRLGKGPS